MSRLEWAMTQYGEALIRLAYTYVKDVHIAEDIIQDVFLKAYELHDQYRGDASFKTYLYRMTINRCKDHLRSWSFRNLFFTNVTHELCVEIGAEDTIIRFEEDYEFGIQILALPVKYREVLVLHYYQDYSITEIADLLKNSENTIYTRLRRAKAQLKEHVLRMEGDSIG